MPTLISMGCMVSSPICVACNRCRRLPNQYRLQYKYFLFPPLVLKLNVNTIRAANMFATVADDAVVQPDDVSKFGIGIQFEAVGRACEDA